MFQVKGLGFVIAKYERTTKNNLIFTTSPIFYDNGIYTLYVVRLVEWTCRLLIV